MAHGVSTHSSSTGSVRRRIPYMLAVVETVSTSVMIDISHRSYEGSFTGASNMRFWQPKPISIILSRYFHSGVSNRAKQLPRSSQDVFPRIEPPVKPKPSLPTINARFQQRLGQVIDGLRNQPMTDDWYSALYHNTHDFWVRKISICTPMQVKELLASELPPTVAQLQSLPWQETRAAGVYGWILNPRKKYYEEEECQLYVGSASKYMFGLAGRKSQHLEGKNYWNRKRWTGTRLSRFIKKNRLNKSGSKFITLMTVKIKSPRPEDVVRVRYLVTFAEAVFTLWLGALDTRDVNDDLRKLCPWGTESLSYLGCSSHNPLKADITQPTRIDDKEGGEGDEEYDNP